MGQDDDRNRCAGTSRATRPCRLPRQEPRAFSRAHGTLYIRRVRQLSTRRPMVVRTELSRRCTTALERTAAQAGTITGVEGIVRRREELDVFSPGRARAAYRSAENPGGPDRDIEKAIKSHIALGEGAVHYLRRRKGRHGKQSVNREPIIDSAR